MKWFKRISIATVSVSIVLLAIIAHIPQDSVYRFMMRHDLLNQASGQLTGYTGAIGKEDVEWGTGLDTDTFTVPSHTAGTVTLTRLPSLYSNIASIIKGEWYVSSDATITDHANAATEGSISWVLAQIGTTNTRILKLPPATYAITQNASWGSYTNITWDMIPGAQISHGAYTVTVDGHFKAGPDCITGTGIRTFNGSFEAGNFRVFLGTGYVRLAVGSVQYVNDRWFGTVNDGTIAGAGTDNKLALQASINASAWAQVELVPNPGIYAFSGKLLGSYDVADNPGFPTGQEYHGRLRISGVIGNRRTAYTSGVATGTVWVSSETASADPVLSVSWNGTNNNANSTQIKDLMLIADTAAGVPVLLYDHISNSEEAISRVTIIQTGDGDGFLWDGIFDVDLGGLQIHKVTPLSGGGSVGFALRNELADGTDGSNIVVRNCQTYGFDEGFQIGHYDFDLSLPCGKVSLINCDAFSNTATEGNPGTIGYRLGRISSVLMANCNAEGDWSYGITMGSGSSNVKVLEGTISGTIAPIVVGYGTASVTGADKAASAWNVLIEGVDLTIRRPIAVDWYPTGFPGERSCVWVKNDPAYTLLYNIEIKECDFSRAGTAVAVAPYDVYNTFLGVRIDSTTYGLEIRRNGTRAGVTYMLDSQHRLAQYVESSLRGPEMFQLRTAGARFDSLLAPPPSGAYKTGDYVFDQLPVSGGATVWACTGTTDDTPTDAAGDTTSGSATVTGVADTSDFTVGEYVTASAGFATTGPYLLLAKTATTLKIDSVATSSQNNITVTEQVPTWAYIYSGIGPPQTGVAAMTNLTAPANLDADTVTTAELADIVGRLIARLRSTGIVGD